MKRGCFQEALQKYSDCLTLKPEECALYTNRYSPTSIGLCHCPRLTVRVASVVAAVGNARRAICFLKLSRFQEAKQDCDLALQLEPSNKKAFYRRALAHKGLQVRSALYLSRLLLALLSHDSSFCGRTTCRPAATSRKSCSWTPTSRRPSRNWRR